MPRFQTGLMIAMLASGVALACGGKDDDTKPSATTGGANGGGEGGAEGGAEETGGARQTGGVVQTGGTDGGAEETGGVVQTGGSVPVGGLEETGGTEETGGVAGSGAETGGTGGGTGTAGIDDLVAALCGHEFGCCDDGERAYRLATAGTSVEECIEFFTYQLHDSNENNNPFPAGTATGLLGTLAYTVNLDRVVEDPDGIAECIAAWEDVGCATAPVTGVTWCAATTLPGESPCSLVNLFDPGLQVGDTCTLALAEGDGNDVECPASSTCLDGSHPSNPQSVPICVRRGIAGNPCTTNGDCDFGHYCNAAGRCTAKGDVGDDCSFNNPDRPVPNDENDECREGLRCHPTSLTCVANCQASYPCLYDVECPEGLTCAPLTVGSDSASWHACRSIGAAATARCDDDVDCVAERRCAGGVCQADLNIGADCTNDAECELGSFCDLATLDETGSPRGALGQCTAFFDAGDPCFPGGKTGSYQSGCNPDTAPECVYIDSAWECTTGRLPAGDTCFEYTTSAMPNELSDCATGLACEYAADDATGYTCTAGADLGDDCDAVLSDGEMQQCGAGLFCDPTDSVCVAQGGPGEDCADPNTDLPEPGLCLNGACVEHWNGNGSYLCTDGPVPVENTGDGLTCNGG